MREANTPGLKISLIQRAPLRHLGKPGLLMKPSVFTLYCTVQCTVKCTIQCTECPGAIIVH
jgi:hypothetical protein